MVKRRYAGDHIDSFRIHDFRASGLTDEAPVYATNLVGERSYELLHSKYNAGLLIVYPYAGRAFILLQLNASYISLLLRRRWPITGPSFRLFSLGSNYELTESHRMAGWPSVH